MEIPMVSDKDINRVIAKHGDKGILHVTSFEVGHLAPSPALTVKVEFDAYEPNATVVLVLSPPAAARLCRKLENNLNEYLYGESKDPE